MNAKFCGPKCSLCCTLLSVWGIVQLGIMGICFIVQSPALLEDLYIPEEEVTGPESYIHLMEESFHQVGINCFIATAMYLVTMLISGWQMWLNFRTSSSST